MKHMLIFLSVAAGLLFTSCKKIKTPISTALPMPSAANGEWTSPFNGAEHTMEIKNRSGNSAVFHTSSHTMLYHRQ